MPANLISLIITTGILIPVFLFLVWMLVLRMIASLILKLILVLIIIVIFFFGFRESNDLIFKTLANRFPQMQGVTCFALNEENCRERNDCQASPKENQVFKCVPKSSSDSNPELTEKVIEITQ